MATKTNTKKKTAGKSTSTRSIDVAGLVKKLLLITVAMVWAFILGVLVGKGYKPENAIPEIAQIMPEHHTVTAPAPEVLTAEELGFYDRLKNDQPAKPAPVHQQHTIVRKTQKSPPATRVQPAPSPKKERVTKTPAKKSFKYIYQVAAFHSKKDAMRFQQKIIGKGIKAFVSKPSGGWYRVTVGFQGTHSEIRTLKAKLKTLGINNPILRDKKPA